MKKCELCDSPAKMYCESDRASLCWDCDARVHGANFLVAKHSRTLLCRVCQSPTPWNCSGPKLSPTISVCQKCVSGCYDRESRNQRDNDDGDGDDVDDDRQDSIDDEDDDDDDGGGGGMDEEDEENQVVPWSKPPPAMPSSSRTGQAGVTFSWRNH